MEGRLDKNGLGNAFITIKGQEINGYLMLEVRVG
jgi:hypothetical protein